MPRLNKQQAKKAEQAETGQFDALKAGTYLCQLKEVEVKPGKDGTPGWNWKWEVGPDQDHAGRYLWVYTAIKDDAFWKMKEIFDALGFSTDSDTDELVGEWANLIVTQRIIESGPRRGQPGNNVDRILPADESEVSAVAAGDDADDEEPF